MSTHLDKLNAKIFSEQLHTQFKVHFGGAEPMMLELVEVMERDLSPKIELFTLQFRGPAAPRLPQQTHRLEHDKLGPFAIFLTAIGVDPEQRLLYESVFQRFRKP
jgi:Domain of unknown function (DUF6916)